MDRDAFVEVVEEGQDRAEVVVAYEVLEAVQEDGRTLARLDEMFDRHGDVFRRTRTDARPLAESGRRREERDPPESSGKRRHGDRKFHRGERASGRPQI